MSNEETLVVPVWHRKSRRQEAEVYEHAPEFNASMRSQDDATLVRTWADVVKLRKAERSPRDDAVEREVCARCLEYEELSEQLRLPVTTVLGGWMQVVGVGLGLAGHVVGAQSLMVTMGRMALRLSAPDAQELWGVSASGWRSAVKRMVSAGIVRLVRVGKNKKGMLCLGPWWFEARPVDELVAERGRWSPLEVVLDPVVREEATALRREVVEIRMEQHREKEREKRRGRYS